MAEQSPTIWRNSTVECLYEDGRPMGKVPCEARIEGVELVVAYLSKGQRYTYRGRDQGGGHYRMEAQGFDGRATLHLMAGADVLVGSWTEAQANGMWRIRLDQ